MQFIGRKNQLAQLMSLWRKSASSLVTCQGRRRIGKSRLIEEFAERSDCWYLKISGLAPRRNMTNADQIRNFCEKLSAKCAIDVPVAKNWSAAFEYLNSELVKRSGRRKLVLLDEISWMGGEDPDFAGHLKDAWDDLFKKNDDLVMVLCGSVSSWIQKNILDSTGFVGRVSLELLVQELPVAECRPFWGSAADGVSSREILDMLSVTGGVPMYLEEIDPLLTTDENLRRQAFTRGGTLFKDFNRIFNDVFGAKSKSKQLILRTLTNASKTLSEISDSLGKERNGHLGEALEELELAGFISRDSFINPATGKSAKLDRYRICDNYTRFFLRFIEPYSMMIKRNAFAFGGLASLPGWDTILGLQFENLVLNNVQSLIEYLGLDHTLVLSAAPYRKSGTLTVDGAGDVDVERGCQIDLLLQLKEAMYVVEIKRRKHIDMSIVEEVKRKIARLPNPGGVSIRQVLFYDGELSPSVVESGYFAATIDAAEFFGLKNNARKVKS